jgi:hypothetical protein
MLVYPRDSCGNTICCLFAYLLICISQAGLELASGSMGALLFSHCNVMLRSFIQASGSGFEVLILFGALFLPSVAPVSQEDF